MELRRIGTVQLPPSTRASVELQRTGTAQLAPTKRISAELLRRGTVQLRACWPTALPQPRGDAACDVGCGEPHLTRPITLALRGPGITPNCILAVVGTPAN